MKTLRCAAILIVTFLVANAAFASKMELTLHQPGQVAGTLLSAGVYRIELNAAADQVTILAGKKAVASAPCRIEKLSGEIAGDSVVYRRNSDGTSRIARIVLADAKIMILIEEPAASLAVPPMAQAPIRN